MVTSVETSSCASNQAAMIARQAERLQGSIRSFAERYPHAKELGESFWSSLRETDQVLPGLVRSAIRVKRDYDTDR